jgi:hypothetical protein
LRVFRGPPVWIGGLELGLIRAIRGRPGSGSKTSI